jgi:hypothetical protein
MDNPPRNLSQWVCACSPQRLLLVGAAARVLAAGYLAKCPQCVVVERSCITRADEFEDLGVFDLAVVAGAMERLEKRDALQLLARLRDTHCQRLLAVVAMGRRRIARSEQWTAYDMLALGFSDVGGIKGGDGALRVYAFDWASYKMKPSWLHAKSWARGETGGKHWR